MPCRHCGRPNGAGAVGGFCCAGCQAVHAVLLAEGLERFYTLQGDDGQPVAGSPTTPRDHKWLEPLAGRVRDAERSCRTQLDVQGIHCAACVWLLQELFDRQPGGLAIVVNPALGQADLVVDPSFPLREFVEDVERFGYVLGPGLKRSNAAGDDLLFRLGICVALAGNTMMFAAAIYLGLRDGPLFTLFHQINYALAVVAVLVGGSVFFRSALQGLRRRVLHLDLPIAVGIALAFLGSTWSFFQGARATYFDTVTVFIALMLLGRWLQERVLEKNRRQLLDTDGVDGLLARRVEDGRVRLVPATRLSRGDTLLVAPGDLVPVDARLDGAAAFCSLDWIDGESRPVGFEAGEVVPAGAFNAGDEALELTAEEDFAGSSLVALLRGADGPTGRSADASSRSWWSRIARIYVVAVLVAAGGGLLAWYLSTADLVRSLEVATAVLVVTCPCAFGIATPLAYELVVTGLRRAGLFVRTRSFLDRAAAVRKIVFDKTGTLTTGALHVAADAPLRALSADERNHLYDLAARSGHPKSVAVKRALEAIGGVRLSDRRVREEAGRGVSSTADGRTRRLGSPAWAAARDRVGADVVYSIDGTAQAAIDVEETLRPDAAAEVEGLRRGGHEVFVLSGDAPAAVADVAERLGLPAGVALGGLSPTDKARWLRDHDDRDTLMIGDGINDSLAVDGAWCSGTPAVDRPFMPARTDFYFVTPGLRPIALSLRAARALRRVVRRNLMLAAAYNAVAVGLAWAGLMEPWLAAVLMPVSSLLILALTAASLSRRCSLWTS